ncbi:zinc finger protein 512 isoform X1 [Syngnathus typhle]|uniref:zinc finger protein 512 isoform X1 n=1 Tax=Syngnathus typhle TaxID=161592 RepID=UPI002A69956B|nr:zinc finger protein 512 isoform X1 [Syngnathus typhle]XP_061126128.1 zinc finger protein 512 isoform X1 [Syngnathus typhle]
MKRGYAGKRYQNPHNVSINNPSTSCSGLAKVVRLPPRLLLKDMWPHSKGTSQFQDRNFHSWTPGGEPPQEQLWPDEEGHSSQQDMWTVTAGRDNNRGQYQAGKLPSSEPNRTWNPSRNLFCRPDSVAAMVGSVQNDADVFTLQPSEEEQKRPPVISSKKEPPTYPPGSPEEQWQLQIVARGRVNCPKCKSVSRKTVEGLKKHMDNCRLQAFTCQHCGKQLRSSTGMKYHIMADHGSPPSVEDIRDLDVRVLKDKLRKILKQLGKVKCPKEGCTATFSSIMGYMYHIKKCGKEQAELDKMLLTCSHCGKAYKSKAGLEYHLKSEHTPVSPEHQDEAMEVQSQAEAEKTASGRIQRASAQLANFHMAQMSNKDPSKDCPKRPFQSDLVPDDKKLKYLRPGLPAFSQELLRKWKDELKLHKKLLCPNQVGCGCTYTSVSGLKAHLGLCTRGDFEVGTYQCLLCDKEFHSESGVKYHINATHSQEWFVTNKKATMKLKRQPRETVYHTEEKIVDHHHHYHHPLSRMQRPFTLLCTPVERSAQPVWLVDDVRAEQAPIELEEADKMVEGKRKDGFHPTRSSVLME